MKCSRCGDLGGGTHDVSGLLGGLNPPEGLRTVWTEDWRQGGELKGDNQSGSEKNLSQALTHGSLRRLQSWDGSQKGYVQNLLLVRSILPNAPQRPPPCHHHPLQRLAPLLIIHDTWLLLFSNSSVVHRAPFHLPMVGRIGAG